MLKKPQHNGRKSELDQLKELETATQLHLSCSNMYLRILRDIMTRTCGSEINDYSWKILKEGSYYLNNAYKIVKIYKDYKPGSINDKNIQTINDILVELEFDPKHMTSGYRYGNPCFVSKGQEMVEINIDIPAKKILKSTKQRLKSAEMLVEAIKRNSLLEVDNCIKDGVIVNFKDTHGRTPLHHAVDSGDIDIVRTLLKNGAKVTQITNKGNTPLHLASSKGYCDIIDALLQYVSADELKDFINAKTTPGGTTSLHIAAQIGFFEVVKSLLKYGGTYNIKNNEGKLPIELCEEQNITQLLKLIEELFEDIKIGDIESICKLKTVKHDAFLAIINTRNSEGDTLLQIATTHGHKNIATQLLEMLKETQPILLQVSPEDHYVLLQKIKSVTELHIHYSHIYLNELRNISPYSSIMNDCPWKTLKKGSHYLYNAYKIVETYKSYVPGSIDDKDIQLINGMLVKLEFDPKHLRVGYPYKASGRKVKPFVSKGQGTKYYNLLHSALNADIRSFIGMVKLNIDFPAERFLESIKQKLQPAENLLDAITRNNHLEVENCIKMGVLVNFKDTDGRTPLHHAVNNGSINVVKRLLQNGAKITPITNGGITLLHIASFKGYNEIVDTLLQYTSVDELKDFLNSNTGWEGTSLHIASKNGFYKVVKSLLKYGATYNIKNNEGKIPIDLSEDQNVTTLLKLIEELFEDIKYGNVELISKLKTVKRNELSAITNACNNDGNTLLQAAIANEHGNIANQLLEMLKEPEPVQHQYSCKSELVIFENLKRAAELHLNFSDHYLPLLWDMSEPYYTEINGSPWKTVKEGSYYLNNAYRIVKVYKNSVPGPIDDENIQLINDTLAGLEFDPKHLSSGYTNEAYGGTTNCFVSKGHGSKYYNLLHSELKKDIRLFIEMVQLNIDVPAKKFLESTVQKIRSADILLEAIKRNNRLGVENCIKKRVIINFKDTDGRTPLHYAVNNGNINVVRALLENGATVTQITNKGNTPLHLASSKGYCDIIDVLLQYVNVNESTDYINAKTTRNGTTSLHVASKNGFFDVVKSLLKHGAIYNMENNEGKSPIELSEDQNITEILRLIQKLFSKIKEGDVESICKLESVRRDEFLALTNACNNEGNTLLQVAIINKHMNIASKILSMLEKPEQV
ncbi:hypothetical protein HHI36_013728 [Cryptolaemus montrouzieri]|uniref:Uncharacterized protein n=1 Tax=Cryptolaemus montrouzieri TaxID=559131 RepID=A0ABD2NI42_9CUCU